MRHLTVLKYIEKIARTGSLRSAAEELNRAATSMEQVLQHEAPDQLDEPLTDIKAAIDRTIVEIQHFLRK